MKNKIISAIWLITILSGLLAASEFIQAGERRAALWAAIAVVWSTTGYFAIFATEHICSMIDTLREEHKRQAQLLADLTAQERSHYQSPSSLPLLRVSGYWVEDGKPFKDYIVKQTDLVEDADDDEIFFYGLKEAAIKASLGQETEHEFVITSVEHA